MNPTELRKGVKKHQPAGVELDPMASAKEIYTKRAPQTIAPSCSIVRPPLVSSSYLLEEVDEKSPTCSHGEPRINTPCDPDPQLHGSNGPI